MKKSIVCLLVLAFCSFLYAQDSSDLEQYRLRPTDVVKITVHEQDDLETKTRITQDGYITFPLLGKVKAAGLTVQELENLLKQSLEADYLVNAQVVVFIDEYHTRQFSVLGEVNSPGKFDMPTEKDVTLLEAIAMAGGFTKDADITKTMVMRVTEGQKETIKINVKDITEKGQKEKDILLEPEDVVVVPESFF
ncbi:MAG: polysaccharide export protein [Candidatus Omnitrophica bacterium]|nr:polysaccharide export protein [Candidatus Omnitrophota bacterium]